MDNEKKKGYMRPRLLLITFGLVLYTILQRPEFLGSALDRVWSIISSVVYGLCIAFVVNVFLDFVERFISRIFRGKLRGGPLRAVGMLATLALLLGAIVLIILVIVPAIADTVSQIISYLPQSIGGLSEWTAEKLEMIGFSESSIETISTQLTTLVNQITDFLQTQYMKVMNTALSVTSSVLDVVMTTVISMIFAIYVLAGKEKIGRFIGDGMRRFLPERKCTRINEVAHLSFNSFSSFVKGQLLEACILGALCFAGMLIFRFPNAAVVSLLIGVTALIPIFGAWIGAGVGAFLILIVDPTKSLWFLVFILILQQIEGNLIYPRVVGSSLGLPGIIVLAAVTIGGNIAGVMGMLLGVPTCSVVYVLLKQAIYGSRSAEKPAPVVQEAKVPEAAEAASKPDTSVAKSIVAAVKRRGKGTKKRGGRR